MKVKVLLLHTVSTRVCSTCYKTTTATTFHNNSDEFKQFQKSVLNE